VTPEELAIQEAEVQAQLAELSKAMQKMARDAAAGGFEIRKGEIAAISDTTSPPTCSINISGDTATLINGVAIMQSYAPQIGQTCLVAKQGADVFLLGAISATSPFGVSTTSNGWQQATLTNGSHGGNSNGNIYYRRINDHGSWKMQWRGGWTVSGVMMIDTANALDSDFRPGSKRSLLTARQIQTGATAAQFDFHSDGRVELVGGETVPTISGSTGSGGSFSVGSHSHGFYDTYGASGEFFATDSTFSDGSFSVGSHTHSVSAVNDVNAPSWVSLNGLEYFL
jgi:hypothetical protein